jgi:uncharacterized damage-inducible protein DinB
MSIVYELKELKTNTLKYFDMAPGRLLTPYAQGKWDAHRLLLHIADAEAVFFERMRRMAVSDKPKLADMAPDLWCEKLDYPKRSRKVARGLFVASRDGVLEMVDLFFPKLENRQGHHSVKGTLTLKELVEFLIWHNRHHLDFVEKAVQRAG